MSQFYAVVEISARSISDNQKDFFSKLFETIICLERKWNCFHFFYATAYWALWDNMVAASICIKMTKAFLLVD